MQPANDTYDVAIIGGGLGGLALSIQLAGKGYRTVLFEKEKYPFHKVCGEYISMESWPFLQQLGIPLQQLDLPQISHLQLSAPSGKIFSAPLPLGGFGISRFLLDNLMFERAVLAGVTVLQETRVDDVQYSGGFRIRYAHKQETRSVQAVFCCGAFGKRSNLDIRWQRPFTQNKVSRMDNYVAVKYHIHTDWPAHLIGLHNFENGYCGISRIEDNRFCLCYLTTAANLKKAKGSIPLLEQDLLCSNPVLKKVFLNSTRAEGFPVTIAQVSFSKKTQAEKNVLLVGDAAGMITPLCGNGMSMALHSSKIAYELAHRFLQNELNLQQLLQEYHLQWNRNFGRRMAAGRTLQQFFGRKLLSNLFVSLFLAFPRLAAGTIRQTHGKPF